MNTDLIVTGLGAVVGLILSAYIVAFERTRRVGGWWTVTHTKTAQPTVVVNRWNTRLHAKFHLWRFKHRHRHQPGTIGTMLTSSEDFANDWAQAVLVKGPHLWD